MSDSCLISNFRRAALDSRALLSNRNIGFALAFLMLSLAAACRPAFLDPQRLNAEREDGTAMLLPSVTRVVSDAPTPTAEAAASIEKNLATQTDSVNGTITIWVNETSQAHAETLDEMVADFAEEEQVLVEVVMVSPRLLPQLVQQAVISDTLPDLIVHPITFSAGWAEEGILDPGLTAQSLEDIGELTFDPDALNAVRQNNDQAVAIPSDGWQQLLIYRSDWFADLGLDPPENYNDILIAAEKLYDPEESISGIVVPTDASLVTTQQVFEHLAIANGCKLVEPDGRVALLHPTCLEALEFYRNLINQFSPIGFQTDVSSVNAYLSGRTGMIITTPAVLPFLAGLVEQNPTICPDCLEPDYLSKNSAYITRLNGGATIKEPSGFSELTAIGFVAGANREPALAFVNYWFNEGYTKWLRVNPERKVPMRLGTQERPKRFIESWGNFPLAPDGPTVEDVFGTDIVSQMTDEIASSERWGIAEDEGLVASIIYRDLLLSPLLQDMLSGYFTSSQTIIEMYQATVDAIPGYEFPIEIGSTPTP